MVPAEVTPLEARQFNLVIQRTGADPTVFQLRKFRRMDGSGYKVRVVGRGAATVYDVRDADSWIGQFAHGVDQGLFGTESVAGLPPAAEQRFAKVQQALARGGLQGALEALNHGVPHRFTALYRRMGDSLHNVGTADKHLHLEALDLRVVPLKDSFCQFVLRDGLFLTRESGKDTRLDGHPYAGVVGCYAGVPVRDVQRRPAGTLCHFDLESHDVSDDEYLVLDRAAYLLTAFLAL